MFWEIHPLRRKFCIKATKMDRVQSTFVGSQAMLQLSKIVGVENHSSYRIEVSASADADSLRANRELGQRPKYPANSRGTVSGNSMTRGFSRLQRIVPGLLFSSALC